MLQRLVEKVSSHFPGSIRIGMRKSISLWRSSAAHRGQRSSVLAEHRADIVQPEAMRELAVYERRDMAPVRKCARVALRIVLSSQGRNRMIWNQVAELLKN